jgi:hypothetical protein
MTMTGVIEMPPAVTLESAGARIRCSRRTVDRLIAAGELEAVRPHARCTLVTLASLEQYERRQAAASES